MRLCGWKIMCGPKMSQLQCITIKYLYSMNGIMQLSYHDMFNQ